MTMNREQGVVLRAALVASVLAVLFPPWGYGFLGAVRFAGYAWVFDPPPGASLALPHFLWQTAAMALVFFLGYRLAGDSSFDAKALAKWAVGFKKTALTVLVLIIAAPASRANHALHGGFLIDLLIAGLFVWAIYSIWREKAPVGSPDAVAQPVPKRVAPKGVVATVHAPSTSALVRAAVAALALALLAVIVWMARGTVEADSGDHETVVPASLPEAVAPSEDPQATDQVEHLRSLAGEELGRRRQPGNR